MDTAEVKNFIDGLKLNTITFSDLPELIVKVMKFVEKFNKLDGLHKKNLVIDIVKKTVDDSDVFGSWETVILPMIGPMIDQIISVDKKEIKINQKWTKCFC